MVSGMLTAIRDFVRTRSTVAEDEGLQTLKVGDLSVWIEQGPHALLAVVVRGSAPPSLRTALQQALEAVHAQYSDLLESFDGDTARFEGTRPLLEACVQQQFRGRERPGILQPRLMVIAAIRAARAWRVDVLRAAARGAGGMATSTPSAPSRASSSCPPAGPAGSTCVTGLRDPLAPDPALAAAVPQSRTRRGGEPLGAVSGAAPVDRASPAPASSWRLPAA